MDVTDSVHRVQAEAKKDPKMNSVTLGQLYASWAVKQMRPSVTFRQFKNWVTQGRKSARAAVGGECRNIPHCIKSHRHLAGSIHFLLVCAATDQKTWLTHQTNETIEFIANCLRNSKHGECRFGDDMGI